MELEVGESYPSFLLQPVGGLFLLQCNFDLKPLKVDVPVDFYNEALCAWQKMNCSTPQTKKQIFNEILWNHHIKMARCRKLTIVFSKSFFEVTGS